MAGIFDDSMSRPMRAKTLLDTDTVIVQNRRHVQDAHGGYYVDVGDPLLVVCSVEGRAQEAGMFSISGAEDKNPVDSGGLQEVTAVQILAREWPGDIYSLIWIDGDPCDADGAPVWRKHATGLAACWMMRARRVVDVKRSDVPIHAPNPVMPLRGER